MCFSRTSCFEATTTPAPRERPESKGGRLRQHIVHRSAASGAGHLGLDIAALLLRDLADFQHRIDEEAQADLGRQTAGAGVGGMDQAERFQIGHDVSDRGRRQRSRQDARDIAGADRLAGREISVHDLAENLARALVQLRQAKALARASLVTRHSRLRCFLVSSSKVLYDIVSASAPCEHSRAVKEGKMSVLAWTRNAALAFVFAALVVGLSPAGAQTNPFFRIGTGGTAATYFPIGGLIAHAISNPPGSRACADGGSCGVPGLVAIALATNASVANIEALEAGTIEAGFSQSDIAHWAYGGTGVFEGRGKFPELRAIANLYSETMHLVARKGAGISTVADLRGKRVCARRARFRNPDRRPHRA